MSTATGSRQDEEIADCVWGCRWAVVGCRWEWRSVQRYRPRLVREAPDGMGAAGRGDALRLGARFRRDSRRRMVARLLRPPPDCRAAIEPAVDCA